MKQLYMTLREEGTVGASENLPGSASRLYKAELHS